MPNRYASEEVARAVDHYTARTIPVHVSLVAKEAVLSQPEAEKLLAESRTIGLGQCGCREKQGRCDAPRDVCITLNAEAEEAIARGTARAVGLTEALDALRRSHEAGLVHLAYRHGDGDGDVGVFCSCCTCCCWFLSALREFDYHDAIAESAFVVRFDEEKCVGCGACVERCPFAAWAADAASSKGMSFSPNRCFGCGLCVGRCPTGALALVPRDGASG